MDILKLNSILESVKERLHSLDPARMEEEHKKPSEHSSKRMAAARRRLDNLYSKLTANRSDANKIHATGSKR